MTKIPELQWGKMALLARRLGRPETTIFNWRKYCIPEDMVEEVESELKNMEREFGFYNLYKWE